MQLQFCVASDTDSNTCIHLHSHIELKKQLIVGFCVFPRTSIFNINMNINNKHIFKVLLCLWNPIWESNYCSHCKRERERERENLFLFSAFDLGKIKSFNSSKQHHQFEKQQYNCNAVFVFKNENKWKLKCMCDCCCCLWYCFWLFIDALFDSIPCRIRNIASEDNKCIGNRTYNRTRALSYTCTYAHANENEKK